MKTVHSTYQGNIRIQSTHLKSSTQIQTDAPVDNHGKGTRFSPTDLLATAYLNCMMTIIGIYCENHQINFVACEGEVEKIMKSNPRRVGELIITLDVSKNDWTEEEKQRIEKAAKACPVAKSVSPDMDVKIVFNY